MINQGSQVGIGRRRYAAMNLHQGAVGHAGAIAQADNARGAANTATLEQGRAQQAAVTATIAQGAALYAQGTAVAQANVPANLADIRGLELHLDGLSEGTAATKTTQETALFTTAVFFKNRTN